ncbi:MAG: Fe-S cluster assembly ATPase SufC [Puniceicoccales bacterium]|jgi:Fe-S cluster assembly ATP-binding protein|nr:Fe-S cluster assembly ATPase SufC [Puniceicoccales bacterium]
MRSALAIRNLYLNVAGKAVLHGLSLAVPAGEIHVLMGRNGSGKSSFVHALVGQIPVAAGEVSLDGVSLLGLPPEIIAQKGLFLAFQTPVALPGVTITQLLRSALQARQEKGKLFDHMQFHDDLEAAMEFMGMDASWASRHVNDGFSGGERKRCEMLQALILKPKYVLLDEIDSGLDVDATRIMVNAIRLLHRRGTGMLIVTHHSRWLEVLAPNGVHLLSDGVIHRSGGMELARAIEAEGFQAAQ